MRLPTPLALSALLPLALGITACNQDFEPVAVRTIDPSASESSSASPSEPSSASPSARAQEPSSAPSSSPDSSPSPDAPRQVSFADLKVGDCIAQVPKEGQNVSTLPVVDCATPHERELAFIGESTRAVFDEETVQAEVSLACKLHVVKYVGDNEDDNIASAPFYATESAWNSGNRTYFCFALMYDGSLVTGSLKGNASAPDASAAAQGSERT